MQLQHWYDYRDDHAVVWEWTPEQAEQLEQGYPVAWYGEEQLLTNMHGQVTIVRSAARPGNVPPEDVRGF